MASLPKLPEHPTLESLPSNMPPDGESPDIQPTSRTGLTNGNHATNGPRPNGGTVPLQNKHALTPRKLRIITIGAGFSGLLIAHKLQHRFPEMQDYVEHIIFEGRHDLGGTWLTNTYPGVQCDVPSHVYAFPFDPNPNWSRFFSSGAEIEDYIRRTSKKWNLDRDVQLNTKVIRAEWISADATWKVEVEKNGERKVHHAEVLISGQGVLLHPNWPEIPGLHEFKGHVTHSAAWDHSFDYSKKRIAVLGNGSSGIQIVPKMVDLPDTDVTNFIRGPSYVYYRVPPSRHLGREIDDPNPAYLEEEKQKFRDNPEELKKYRKGITARTNKAFRMFVKGSEANDIACRDAASQMAEKLGNDPDLCRKLIPKWQVGCRRVTPGPGYLESFLKPNCHLVNSSIIRISENAIHTADGQIHPVDVVVCATGFDVSHRPRYPFIGLNGVNLRDKWEHEPESYMSVAVSEMPNYFMMMGPNAVVGHGSLMECLNWTGDYIVKWIKRIATEDIKSVVPKASVVDEFVKYGDEIMKTLVWTGDCKSWYKRNRVDGRVTALFGGSALLYKHLISSIRGEDFDIEYLSGNRFGFMGDGFTIDELDKDYDLAWYIEN